MHDPSSPAPLSISIITICKNAERSIAGTIASVVPQKSGRDEYLIIDGASTDRTMSIVSSMKGVDRVISEPDEGIADAFNKGIGHARGEIIALVNAGDRLMEGALHTVRGGFAMHPSAEVIHGDVVLVEHERVIKRIRPSRFWWEPWRLVLFNHPATFVRRSVYERYGGFDLSYRVAMDVEIFFRWKRNRVPIRYIPVPLVLMERGGVSSVNDLQGYGEFRRAAIRHGYSPVLASIQYMGKLAISRVLRLMR